MFIASRNLSLPAIYACDHEVTQGEYETYCKYGRTTPSSTSGVGTNYPAYNVSWYDAIVYCNLRSKADGLTPCYKLGTSNDTYDSTDVTKWDGVVKDNLSSPTKYCGPSNDNVAWNGITCDWTANGWRLPTRAEWEMLARGGNLTNENQTTYSGSNTVGDVAWCSSNSDSKTHVVKTNKVENKDSANSLGLYDMSGNVWEWCWDFYNKIDSNTAWTGPTNASTAVSWKFCHVICGGSYHVVEAEDCSVNCSDYKVPYLRCYGSPAYHDGDFGFRVVRNAQ